MALSDYMPYGAPELLEGASPRLASSTLMASGLVALVFCTVGVLALSRPAQPVRLDDITSCVFLPAPVNYEPTPEPRVPPVHVSRPEGELNPVADEKLVSPTIESSGPIDGDGSAKSKGEPDALPTGGRGDAPPPPDPPQGVYVYTDELPQLVRGVKPVYPDLAREAGVEGTVKLDLLVGLDGHVLRATVRKGGSVPMLDDAAIAAALATVFTPALANNRPVKVWVTQDYRFTLH